MDMIPDLGKQGKSLIPLTPRKKHYPRLGIRKDGIRVEWRCLGKGKGGGGLKYSTFSSTLNLCPAHIVAHVCG